MSSEMELDCAAAAKLPDTLRFTRNGRSLEARRVRLGEVRVSCRVLRIADAMYDASDRDGQPRLPVRAPNGTHTAYAYQWEHPTGAINVCAVVAFRDQLAATTRRLEVNNETRTDITHGVIVDTKKLTIWSETAVTFEAGLGDGVYPVLGVYNLGLVLQAVVVDLRVWKDESHRIVLRPGQEFDEFGIVRRVGTDTG